MSDFGKLMQEKCMAFAIRIVNLCRYLNEEKHEYRIADQLFRSGTAISKKDFRSKVYVALKESNESLFWLDLLKNTGVLEQRLYDSIYPDCEELKKLLVSIAKSSSEEPTS